MKRLFSGVLFLALTLLFCTCVLAQEARIIDVKGNVSVKKEVSAQWEKAKINMLLGKDAEVKTYKDSFCTLAFDEELKNVMRIQENSQMKLETVIPAKIFLPEGRVFSLIDNLAAVEKFEIRTPTAVAGARGTGLSVTFSNSNTVVICYEHMVYVMDLTKGITGQLKELAEKFGITLGPDGSWQGPLPLTAEQLKEWQDFLNYIQELRGNLGIDTTMGDLQWEGRESESDSDYEHRRQDKEDQRTPGGNNEFNPR